MHEGVDGLLRDKTRPPGKPRLPDAAVRRVLDLTLAEPPGAAVAAAEAGIEVVLAGAAVRVSPGVDPGLLSAVLRAVRASQP